MLGSHRNRFFETSQPSQLSETSPASNAGLRMTAKLSRIRMDGIHKRAILLLHADTFTDARAPLDVGSTYFVSLLAWDARSVEASEIAQLARHLLDAGCVYFCCWGPGCERVHDIIDEEYVGSGTGVNDSDPTILTTWHSEESLEEATRFALNDALPDDRLVDRCGAVVLICVGNSEWKAALQAALEDPRVLAGRVIGEEDSRRDQTGECARGEATKP